ADKDCEIPKIDTMSYGMGNAFGTDGAANTMMFATKYAVCGEGGSRYAADPTNKFAAFFGAHAAKKPAHPSDKTATYQLKPQGKDCCTSPAMAQSFSDQFLSIVMGDAVVRQVSPKVSAATWNTVVHPDDRGVIKDPNW